MQQFSFAPMTVKISQTSIHPIVEALGCNNKPDEFFKRDFSYFSSYYDRPVAIKVDDCVQLLNQTIDYYSLVESGADTIDVYVTNIECEFDIRRFIGFRHAKYEKDLAAEYNTIKYLQDYRKTEEGKEFFETIPGRDYGDKIGVLMGRSGSRVGRVQEIGDQMPEYLDKITVGESTFVEAQNKIKTVKLKENAAKKEKTHVPSKKDMYKSLVTTLQTLHINFEDITAPFALLNGNEFSSLNLTSSVEVTGGVASITLKDNAKNGLVIKIKVENFYNTKVLPLTIVSNSLSNAA